MAVPRRLLHALQDSFGKEAAEDMTTWIEEVNETHGDLRRFREEMREFRIEVRGAFAAVQERFGRVDERIGALETRLTEKLADTKADLMKWSFVFWCGAVAAIAMLAGVLG